MKEDEMDWAGITNCRKLEIHKKKLDARRKKKYIGKRRNISF